MHGVIDIIKSGSKIKVVFAMSPCRLVYSDDVAEVLTAPYFRRESVNEITQTDLKAGRTLRRRRT